MPELVAATGSRHLGGFSLFQAGDSHALENWVLTDMLAEGSSYQGETKGACCGGRSWNVGISDQAVCQGQRHLI